MPSRFVEQGGYQSTTSMNSRNRNKIQTMEPIEALLNKKLDKLESEVYLLENPMELSFSKRRADAIRSKLSFLKSLVAAETGGRSVAGRLNHITSRVSAIESIFSKTATCRLRLVILRKNVQELESLAKEPFSHISATKIRSKIAFTKSLLSVDAQSEEHCCLSERLAAVEKAFGHLSANDDTQPSWSSTLCHTEEEGLEEAAAFYLSKEIEGVEKEGNKDHDYDVQRKIGFLRYHFAGEMKRKEEEKAGELQGVVKRLSSIRNEFVDRDMVFDDDIGGTLSSSCSCTSSCFDGNEDNKKQAEKDEKFVNGANKTGELRSAEIVEVLKGKSETADSEKGSVEMGEDGGTRFLNLRAVGIMVGVFVVAAVGVVVRSFFSAKEMVYFVPT